MDKDLPPISVVVIGRNEGARLIRCLKSVKAADYPAEKIELIYVDTASTDGSCEAAEKLGAKVIRIQPERPTAAAGRNAGLRAATHDLVHFLDGDTVLNRAWLRKAVSAMDAPDVAGVFGRVEEIAPTATIYNYWMHHDWYVPPGRTDTSGGNVLFRRRVLLEAGGYDASLIAGEERDLCCRLVRDQEAVMLSLDEPMILHDVDMTSFGQYWRRCVRAGYGYAQVAARYPGLRRWRRTCRRNIVHASGSAAVVAASFGLWSVWPVGVWAVLLVLAIGRDALRGRARVGSLRGAMLCAVHHYLSKAPTVVGHLAYYRRHVLGGTPMKLIEYKVDANNRNREPVAAQSIADKRS